MEELWYTDGRMGLINPLLKLRRTRKITSLKPKNAHQTRNKKNNYVRVNKKN